MAKLKGSILGKLRGTVGDFTSRVFKGENIVCDLPASFTPPNDNPAIARRQSFAMSSKLTRAINSIPILKIIWNSRKPEGTNAYNFIFQTNYRQLKNGSLTDLNTITPLFGFPIVATTVNFTSASFNIEIAPIGSSAKEGFNLEVEVSAKIVMLMHMSQPVDTQGSDFFLNPVVFDSVPLQTEAPLIFTKNFSDEDKLIYEKYGAHKAYFALITLDVDGNPVKFSNTITGNA